MSLNERIALKIAEANNGGTWATHYTEKQKDVWRERARVIIQMVEEEYVYDNSPDQ